MREKFIALSCCLVVLVMSAFAHAGQSDDAITKIINFYENHGCGASMRGGGPPIERDIEILSDKMSISSEVFSAKFSIKDIDLVTEYGGGGRPQHTFWLNCRAGGNCVEHSIYKPSNSTRKRLKVALNVCNSPNIEDIESMRNALNAWAKSVGGSLRWHK